MRKKILFILLCILPLLSHATHLIGGEMTYTCLGNNLYEIRLVIYRDCGPSNTTGTGFDDDAIIMVYNAQNIEVEEFEFSDPETTILSNETVGNDCLEIPPELCVERGVYTSIIELPPIEGGYQIAYQRCCRNPSIINIVTPDDFGSTLTAHIPGSDEVSECNNSPIFNDYPPLALCLGDQINVDLSASDIDGDSLVYEFSVPFHGANDFNPTQTSAPPFTEIPWVDGFSSDYPITSNPPININSSTGFITGTPSSLGIYIIAVKVSEYRNGILINEIIRDFRFFVVDCNIITASVPITSWYCNSLTVDFINNSFNAENYFWDFGDSNSSSILFEPSHTYPDTGMYTVTLIANPNTVCADTNAITFPLYTELLPYFESPDPECIDNNSFDFFAEGFIPPGATINWQFGPNASISSSNQQNPLGITFSDTGSYPVSYNIEFLQCNETYIDTVEVFDIDIFPEIPNLEAQCIPNNSFDFSAEGIYPENAFFEWNFGSDANPQYSNEQNPSDIEFLNIGSHDVTLNISSQGCENASSSNINIINVSSSIPLANWICNSLTVDFPNNSLNADSFFWDFGDNNATSSLFEPSHTYPDTGTYTVSLVVNPNSNCADTNTVTFPIYTELNPFFETPDSECINDEIFEIIGEGLIPSGTLINWDFGSTAFPSTSNDLNPSGIMYSQAGIYPISLNLQYNECDESHTDSIEIFDQDISPEIPAQNFQCLENNSFNFIAGGTYPENSTFEWFFGANANPQFSYDENPNNIIFSNIGEQNISLNVASNGCDESTNTSIEITDQIAVEISSSPIEGCEPFTVSFESNISSENHLFSWDLGNGMLDSTNSIQTTYSEGVFEVSLTVASTENNCTGSTEFNSPITVLPYPISSFEINSNNFAYGDPVWIANTAEFSSDVIYEFSSGEIIQENDPEIIPSSIGSYEVTQFAYNEFNCADTSTQSFFITYETSFWVPNSFTPNGDGKNESFYPICINVPEYRLQIFSRWGQLIFDEQGENPSWNGKYSDDQLCTEDSYEYLINYRTLDGSWNKRKGVVYLIR